jgi:hypothetical protein
MEYRQKIKVEPGLFMKKYMVVEKYSTIKPLQFSEVQNGNLNLMFKQIPSMDT